MLLRTSKLAALSVTRSMGNRPTYGMGFLKLQDRNGNPLKDKPLTTLSQNDLASFLAEIVKEHPELTALIETWPTLSADFRAAILRIVGD